MPAPVVYGHVEIDPSCIWQGSIDTAAATALARIPKEDKEFGGLLYKNAQGEYCYSTYAPGEKDTFSLKGSIPNGAALAGLYHNHPGYGNAADHSQNDIQMAKSLGVPSYIRVDQEGAGIRKLNPGASFNRLLPAVPLDDQLKLAARMTTNAPPNPQ